MSRVGARSDQLPSQRAGWKSILALNKVVGCVDGLYLSIWFWSAALTLIVCFMLAMSMVERG